MGFSMYTNTDINTGLPTKTPRHHFMMYTPRARIAHQYQQFFFEQREKLSNMLNTVSADARAANGQQICMDYHELTTAVTELLGEAQTYSAFTYEQLERQGVQMEPFAVKTQLVETVATQLGMRLAATRKGASKKRGRSMDDDEEDTEPVYAVKRYRNAPVDYEMTIEPAFCAPHADRYLQTAWWNQPIYQ